MLSGYLVRNKQTWAITRKIVKNSWSATDYINNNNKNKNEININKNIRNDKFNLINNFPVDISEINKWKNKKNNDTFLL